MSTSGDVIRRLFADAACAGWRQAGRIRQCAPGEGEARASFQSATSGLWVSRRKRLLVRSCWRACSPMEAWRFRTRLPT